LRAVAEKARFSPRLGRQVFVDPSASVIGRVTIGDYSSVWPGCVLRGDINRITIGHHTNIQDLSVLHVESDRPCTVGDYVIVGHQVILHACRVRSGALVGMGSVVLDGAVIGEGAILGAGSLVTQGARLKPRSLYFGRPARFVRALTPAERRSLRPWAMRYVRYAADHRADKYGRTGRESV
jgi:carbonic anhydrase/acetyltransferase-like protein (isoleucine patch superfamily)